MNHKIVLVGVLLLLMGCAQKTDTVSGQERMAAMNVITYDGTSVEVVLDDLKFQPPFIHIKPGTTVTWINRDAAPHTVAFNERKTPTDVTESELLKGGNSQETFSFTFTTEGLYDYICGIHPFMHGGIIVGNPPELAAMMEPAADTPEPTATSITPASADVEGGTSVTIKGTNFVEGSTVFFHHVFGDVDFVDATTLRVKVPAHYATRMDIIVTNPDGDHVTLTDAFEFTGAEAETAPAPIAAEGLPAEDRTVHWTGSQPVHGSSVTTADEVSVSFNFPIVKGSTIDLLDAAGVKVASGDLASTRLGLVIADVPSLEPGAYTVKYHAVWLGGTAHDGQWSFVVQ